MVPSFSFNWFLSMRVCSSAGRATVSKAVGRGFKSLRTRPEKENGEKKGLHYECRRKIHGH